jgi:hypothetical protein
MIRVIISMAILLLSMGLGQAGSPVVTLSKEQLGALSAAIHQMQQIGRSYKGQQVVIRDKGSVFYVSFIDDPIDVAVAGDQNGMSWEVRKRDSKVLRPLLMR